MLVLYHRWSIFHDGSYDLNVGSERLILGGDIRSRSWPNIGDLYGILLNKVFFFKFPYNFC